MADQQPNPVQCPQCSSKDVFVVNQTNNLRPRPQTGNLRADMTPISTTLTYKCANTTCGYTWSATISR
jgi:hypothetical protein